MHIAFRILTAFTHDSTQDLEDVGTEDDHLFRQLTRVS